ncbi:MAG: tRNA lysidine(34) synthetase TilS [Spirochaetales bacterium]|nr:tRNA lysidine(34) synthetase TilS [Spirochaetales bacterium]
MLAKRIERFLRTHRVPVGGALLVGYSGGPDSTCLVSLLHGLSSSYRFSLACAFLDHGLRPEAERSAEAELVNGFCRDRAIPLFIRTLAPDALAVEARYGGLSLEETARRARLDFFTTLRREHGFDRLLLAHTLDDQLETIVWRIFQGSGAAGIRGIRPQNGWILRPLLGTTRGEILEYLSAEGLSFSSDSTNAENRFLRNRIRHDLIPVLLDIFPGMGRSLRALSAKMGDVEDYLQTQAADAFAWEETERGVKTASDAFFAAAPALRLYALYSQAGRVRGGGLAHASGGALSYRFFEPLLARDTGEKRKINLRGFGCIIRRRGRWLFLERDIVAIPKKGYFITINAGRPFTLFDRWFVLRMPGDERRSTDVLVCSLEAEKVAPPFALRSRKNGDRIHQVFGTKKLKKLFSEWRVNDAEREEIPLLVDGRGIVAVLGSLRGFHDVFRRGAGGGAGWEAVEDIRLFETKISAEKT